MPTDMPVRTSLLFSPVAEEARRPKYSEVAAASSIFSTNESDSSIEDASLALEPSSFPPSTSVAESSMSGSTNRKSSQTDTASLLLGSGTNATMGHLPLSSNAYNSMSSNNYATTTTTKSNAPPVPPRLSHFPNASHPAVVGAPIAATRFDTVTSYVDVIYQQQQQQQQQQRDQNSSNNASNHHDSDALEEDSEEVGVVVLRPSDGIDGDDSFMATCPKCAMMVMTEFEHFLGEKSYRMACLFTPLLMCWAPLYWDSFGRKWKDVKHWCPKCRSLVAVYRK
jgi:hypothetical protein